MLSFGDFKCSNMEFRALTSTWYCKRRHSCFLNIDAHCGDCLTYIGFLDKLVKELNECEDRPTYIRLLDGMVKEMCENGYLGSEGEKRA